MAIAVILLWFVVGNLCSASELPATAYIDVTDVEDSSVPYLEILAKFIETHGDEADPEKTFSELSILDMDLSGRSEGEKLHHDRYNLAGTLSPEGLDKLSSIIQEIKKLIEMRHEYEEVELNMFLNMIKQFFRDDLNAFASNKPNQKYPKLQAFLLHFGKEIMSSRITRAFGVELDDNTIRVSLEKMIGYDPELEHGMDDLISRARNIDLARGKFNAISMLKRIKDYRDIEGGITSGGKLSRLLKRICGELSQYHRKDIEIYTWSRLLIPDELAKLGKPSEDLLELSESWRVCLPVINKKTFDKVKRNVRKIMAASLFEKCSKNILGRCAE